MPACQLLGVLNDVDFEYRDRSPAKTVALLHERKVVLHAAQQRLKAI
jgi:hypothetical protein